jgi:hypothetical protein
VTHGRAVGLGNRSRRGRGRLAGEIIEEIDREAPESLDTSFDEFLRAHRAGDLPNMLAVNELVTLLRFARLG